MDDSFEEEIPDEPVDVELDRLSSCARTALDVAKTHAEELGDPFIGTDHLLIGLFTVPTGAACRVLTKLEIDLVRMVATMRFIRGQEPNTAEPKGELTFSPRLIRVLEAAAKDAAKRSHTELGTLHLLSGMLREKEGLAVFLLESPGMGLGKAGSAISAAHRDGWKDEDANHLSG